MLRARIASMWEFIKKSRAVEPRVGIAWYQENQWTRLRELSSDADHLEKTYEEWLTHATARYEALLKKGSPVQKVTVDVEDMAAWAHEMGNKMDQAARAAYVVYRLQTEKLERLYPKALPKPKRSFLS